MNAKEIADRLVEKGILQKDAEGTRYRLAETYNYGLPVAVLSDWRVAGRCLEAMTPEQIAESTLRSREQLIFHNPELICEAYARIE